MNSTISRLYLIIKKLEILLETKRELLDEESSKIRALIKQKQWMRLIARYIRLQLKLYCLNNELRHLYVLSIKTIRSVK
ncbi:hypothetical protein AM501_24060 [Aneurinibacillus migulanus]|nr:hypothetical protein TS64_03920 [Aneurinibacillus migulanus]KPD05852.1 hypothetical protein AM501_24060 [Aneurinibacillus migulanus]